MKIEFEWNDLVDLVDEASSDDINRIAHAISDIINVVNSNDGGNVDLSDYVKNTDYATKEVAGVVKVNPSAGIRLTDNNQLTVSYATKTYIDAKSSYVNPIVPALLEYAVQSCTNQDIEAELSEEQLKLPPSAKYLKDSYYTKDEIDAKDEKLQQNIYELQADIVGREEKANKITRGNMLGSWNNYEDNQYLSAYVVGEYLSVIQTNLDNGFNELPYFYATKEEIGDIAEATAAIIALQNKYMGGESE